MKLSDAIHESGHAVACCVLGIPIKRATLFDVTGLVRVDCPHAQYNSALVALAGPCAEDRHCHYTLDERVELWGTAWRQDFANALRNLNGDSVERAQRRARQLVRRHWDAVEALAVGLLVYGELSGDDVAVLMAQHRA
jgi:hypothetical protein